MNINYKLSHSDFVAYQLYTSSKSKLHNKKRFRSRVAVPIFYVLLGFYAAYKNDNYKIIIGFAMAGLLWFVFYPKYSKWRYKKHFSKHVTEHYKNRINKPIALSFNDNTMSSKDFVSESKIQGTELKELIETTEHVFIKLTSDLSLIIPKHAIDDLTAFKNRL